MSNLIFVLDTHKKPLTPCKPSMARKLLAAGKAAVFRRYPFTIILKKAVLPSPAPIALKIDPGSKTTGITIVQGEKVIWGAELTHRGQSIRSSFWVKKLIKFVPITVITQELVRFDLQQIENPEISGVEYQQGELQGYEVREYLLEKWHRKCTYCGAENVPLQVDHVHPKAKGGTNRISNLCLACEPCNLKKGVQDIKEFLAKKPELLKKIQATAKAPLKDAAAVNSTRWALFKALKATGLPVATGSGGQTKFNRTRLNLPKAHWIDAACIGRIESLKVLISQPLLIKATGHGTRQMCGTNKYGFPTRHRSRIKIHKGFQTGDIVKAIVTSGKKLGIYIGRVLCRASGSFDMATKAGRVTGISHKCCLAIHQKDGYQYAI